MSMYANQHADDTAPAGADPRLCCEVCGQQFPWPQVDCFPEAQEEGYDSVVLRCADEKACHARLDAEIQASYAAMEADRRGWPSIEYDFSGDEASLPF